MLHGLYVCNFHNISAISKLTKGFETILAEAEKELKKKYKEKYQLKVRILNEHLKSTASYLPVIENNFQRVATLY